MSMAEFIKVAETRDIPVGKMKLVLPGSEGIVIANVAGRFFAFSNACTHDQGPLAEGDLAGAIITCPWHFSQFDVTTGEVVEPPAENAIGTFRVQVQGDSIYVSRTAD